MPESFATSDLDAAAYLVCREHQLLSVERGANGRSVFRFPPAAAADVGAFYSGALVRAQDFGGALRYVKKAIHETAASPPHTLTREDTHASALQ